MQEWGYPILLAPAVRDILMLPAFYPVGMPCNQEASTLRRRSEPVEIGTSLVLANAGYWFSHHLKIQSARTPGVGVSLLTGGMLKLPPAVNRLFSTPGVHENFLLRLISWRFLRGWRTHRSLTDARSCKLQRGTPNGKRSNRGLSS